MQRILILCLMMFVFSLPCGTVRAAGEPNKELLEELQKVCKNASGEIEGDIDETIKDFVEAQKKINTIQDSITLVDEADKELKEIKNIGQAVTDIGKPMEHIPEVGPDISVLIGIIETLTTAVIDLEKGTHEAREATSGVKEFLKKAEKVLEYPVSITLIYGMVDDLTHWYEEQKDKHKHDKNDDKKNGKGTSGSAASTSRAQASGDIDYACLIQKLDQFGNTLVNDLKATNAVVKELKTPVRDFNNAMSGVSGELEALGKAFKPVDTLSHDLNELHKVMRGVEQAMEKKIGVKIGPYDVGISLKEALKDMDHIEDAIIRSVGKELAKELKKIGLKDAAREIKKEAKKGLQGILDDLNPLKKIKIPGLSEVKASLEKTTGHITKAADQLEAVSNIKTPDVDFQTYKKIKSFSYFEDQCRK